MQLGQVIIASVDSKTEQKNEWVSRSANIDDQLTETLCRWSPGQQELASGQTESINFFPTKCGKLALSRSVVGGLESGRGGGRRTISYIAVIEPNQLNGYHNNAVLLTRVLQSMGMLFLQTGATATLPELQLPDCSYVKSENHFHSGSSGDFEKVVRAIEIHHQVVIIGQPNPLAFLGEFLGTVPLANRHRISFATGMNLSEERPFILQFFRELNPSLEKQLASRQLRVISLTPQPVASC